MRWRLARAAGIPRDDAVVALHWAGYSAFDVMAMVDDARQAAVQEQVAKEMAGS
jgi:hypothetical protein